MFKDFGCFPFKTQGALRDRHIVSQEDILRGLEVLKRVVWTIFIFKDQVKGSTVGNDSRIRILSERQQVFTVAPKCCRTSVSIIELDTVVQEVQSHAKCL